VDYSCLGSPIRSEFDDIIRSTSGHYLAGFSGFIRGSSDVLLTELYAIYKGLLLAKDMNIDEIDCYSDSLHCVNLIKGLQIKYLIHVVLIQDINELLFQINFSLYHTLRERNQYADFFAKLEASADAGFLTRVSPPKDVCDLKNDATIIFFFCE
jgi:ribonuclease HI